jgi:hypothetical protein
MNIQTMTLAELGRFVASRTANTEAAKIAHSTAPQWRYDAVIFQVLHDPQQRREFSRDEQLALAQRIGAETKRQRAIDEVTA